MKQLIKKKRLPKVKPKVEDVGYVCNEFSAASLFMRISRFPNRVWHKPRCTSTEDGQSLEILHLGSRGIELAL